MTGQRALPLVCALGGALLGFVGATLGRAPDAPAEGASESREPATPSLVVAHVDPAELRAAVRAELRAARSDVPLPAGEATPPAAPTSEPLDAAPASEGYAGASECLESALSLGIWSERDSARFHQHLGQAHPEEVAFLMDQLVNAVNEGRMDVTSIAAPL